MEIKFQSKTMHSLCRSADRQQIQEQTQEVRLPDSMPDIGRVLGSWGRVLVRGKEWRGNGMTVSGGVMVWVLYEPEDGTQPRSVEAWIPFQMKWDFQETQHDGCIFVVPVLKTVDARSTSARKLMVRANICAWGRALETVETEYYSADEVPEDINLLTADYPMELPCEAGEKLVPVEEDLALPAAAPVPEKILRYDVRTTVTEQRVLASRLIFRGKGNVHLMYLSDGTVCSTDCEISFSQYADLDREYTQAATAQIVPILTNLDLDMVDGKLRLKCDLAAQYIIYDRVMVQLVEDAYSNHRPVTLHNCQMQLPRRLDRRRESMQVDQIMNVSADKIADVSWLCDLPQKQQNGEVTRLMMSGQMQVLYYDASGNLHFGSTRYEQIVEIPADHHAQVDGTICSIGQPDARINGQQVEVSATYDLEATTLSDEAQWMVSVLEMGERNEPDAGRPSLILRRFNGERLWDAAKECGSTVEAIRAANEFDAEPEPGRILLIPVS